MRRKKAEKLPADFLLGFNPAVKSKAGSLLGCQNLILAHCLEGRSSSQGRRQQEERRRWDEDDKKLERRTLAPTLVPLPNIRPPAPVLKVEFTACRRGFATQTPGGL